ncbi:hypothetical protein CYMTET_40331 [Cymbomonas tetramitiformis]|uniref:Uncharacterized protein n=1 Tax=Cymbomonas tetramitiformis TaxID=36881 RepID=A0AAE0F330_9CHLO|nr:hypothetical protein CYMTET_40331 [Cymbomonas tetramitiformis]
MCTNKVAQLKQEFECKSDAFEDMAEKLVECRKLLENLRGWKYCNTDHSFKKKELIRARFDNDYYYGLVVGNANKDNLLVCVFEDGELHLNYKVCELQVYTEVDKATEEYSELMQYAFNFDSFFPPFRTAKEKYTPFEELAQTEVLSNGAVGNATGIISNKRDTKTQVDDEFRNAKRSRKNASDTEETDYVQVPTDGIEGAVNSSVELDLVKQATELLQGTEVSNKEGSDLVAIGKRIFFTVEKVPRWEGYIKEVKKCSHLNDPEWIFVEWIIDGKKQVGNLADCKSFLTKELNYEVRSNLYNTFKVAQNDQESFNLTTLATRLYPQFKKGKSKYLFSNLRTLRLLKVLSSAVTGMERKTTQKTDQLNTMRDKVDPKEHMSKNTYCVVLAELPDPHTFTIKVDGQKSALLHLVRLLSDYDPASKKVHYQYLQPKEDTIQNDKERTLDVDKANHQGFTEEIAPKWMRYIEGEIVHLWDIDTEKEKNSIPYSMYEILEERIKELRKIKSKK